MKRASVKKAIERRKNPRSTGRKAHKGGTVTPARGSQRGPKKALEVCTHCAHGLQVDDRALFVEEEHQRTFCSEDCIAGFFAPEVERLEKEYFRKLSKSDLSPDDRERLAHLRWVTLQEPDEIWREKTLTGDFRHTLISEFQPGPGDKSVWCVCICLFLRGEPSFLYLAFTTRNAAMVDFYRRGERMQWEPKKSKAAPSKFNSTDHAAQPAEVTGPTDGLADAWTEEETLRAQMTQGRRTDDIPLENFSEYESCVEETLETPDEVWTMEAGGDAPVRLYHFIRKYKDEKPGYWFVIVARETDEEDQIEILDSFPTHDSVLVDRYRQGNQEIGSSDIQAPSRMVH